MIEAMRQYLVEGEQAGLRYALSLPRQAPIATTGATLGNRAGSSLEFREYRDYQPGDDLRHIDWNAYARSDQLAVKLFREEVTPHADIVIDGSRSMALAGTAKERATVALAGFFAAAATNAGFTRSAWLVGSQIEPLANSSGRVAEWDGLAFESRTSATEVFSQGPPRWRPRGVRVFLSDLLWEGDPLTFLRYFVEQSAVSVVVQVLAEVDVIPPEGSSVRIVDAETDEARDVHVDALTARRYREALSRHQQNWHQACRQVGAIFTTLVAERLMKDWKLHELVAAEVLKVV